MNKKLAQMTRANLVPCFVFLFLFAAISAYYNLELAAVEVIIAAAALWIYLILSRNRRRDLLKFLESHTAAMDSASADYMAASPLAMMVFRPESGEIVWCNDLFLKMLDRQEDLFDRRVEEVIPGFENRWLLEGKSEDPDEVRFAGRRYRVFGSLVRSDGPDKGSFVATTYWLDMTEMSEIREKYTDSRPVVAILTVDNYEELQKNESETARAMLRSEIDARLARWTAPSDGILCRYDRDRYLFIFESRYLKEFVDRKFAILDAVHEVTGGGGIAATMSIGIGLDGDSLEERYQFAKLAIEMALSRGGDQAVLKNKFKFEFYGGRAREQEKSTKVKSRVMANSLGELIADSALVLVMGHKNMDLDCCGAAAGVCAIARKKGVKAYIVSREKVTPADAMLTRLMKLPEYQSCLLSPQDAMVMANSRTLLVVVDTNRPEQVQSEDLLQSCNRVAVIDHHRRAATYIQDAAINYHEPYASSASEMVTELMEYLLEPAEILLPEAEALFAGIVLDTKNFTMRTGGRTFETAAFLRRCGVDTAEIKKIFQNNLTETVAKYSIIQNARMVRDGIALATVDKEVGRIPAAQAADELLDISGVEASFVIFRDSGQICISGRSLGEINVQLILEKLGGGGNATTAGAQLPGNDLGAAADQLEGAISQYMENT